MRLTSTRRAPTDSLYGLSMARWWLIDGRLIADGRLVMAGGRLVAA